MRREQNDDAFLVESRIPEGYMMRALKGHYKTRKEGPTYEARDEWIARDLELVDQWELMTREEYTMYLLAK